MRSPSSRPPGEGNSPKTAPADILLVDDDSRNLDVLEAVLSSPDYRFVRCRNAEEALLALVQGDFAAIVLDVQMPGTDGLELARLIKQRRRSSHIPIIFLTAHFNDEKDMLQGYGAGAVDYLTKPVNPGILRSKVSVVVNLFRTTRALTAVNSALHREVEQRQQAEQSLREANTALEARVQERTADLSRINQELRRSEERYRLILENALEYAIFTIDLEGRVTSWNSGAQRVLGFDETEMIGQRLNVIFTAEDRDHGQLDIEMGRAVTNDRAQDERWHLRKDGSPFWATGLMMPLKGEDGQPQGFLKILRDRTQRKLADEARARLAALVQSSSDAIISKNLHGVILNWNAAAERLLGYRADEIIGQSIFRLCPPGREQEEMELLERMRAGETFDHFETFRQTKDGRVIDVSLTVSPIRDEAGNVLGVSSIARDITRQKIAEKLLHESREELRRALEFDEAVMTNMGEGLYTVDLQGLVTSLNPAAEKLLGWSREELLGRRMHDMTHHTHPDGRPFPAEECSGLEVLRTGQALIEHEDVFIRKDGTFFDVIYSSSPLRANGEIVGLVMVFRDVSGVKRAQDDLRRSEALKGAILDSGLDCIITIDQASQIVEFNPAAERTFGHRREEVLHRSMPELLIPAGHRAAHYRGLQHYLATGDGPMLNRRLEMTALRADGSEFPVEVSIVRVPLEGPPLFTAFLREITERKRIETELSERARLLDLSNDAILVRDFNDRIIYWNHGAEKIFGWSRAEALGRNALELLQPEFREPIDRILAEFHRNNRWAGELRYACRDGSRITVATRWALDSDRAGHPPAVLETANDVSARLRAEERVVQLNDTLVSVMESIPDALFITDERGQIRFRNPAAGRFSRLSGHEDRLPPPVGAELEGAMQTGEHLVPTSLKTVHRFVLEREERFFLSRILCMTAADKRSFGAAVMLQDVTELRLLDEIKTNLISTVSHELKTPLTSLRTALLVLCESALGSLNESQKEMLGIARDESERLLRTLNVLLDLTRFEEGATGMRLEKVSPGELIQAAVEELRAVAATGGVTVQAEFEPSLPVIPMDRERMLHVLSNLLSNAIKYSPAGGRVIVRAQFQVDAVRVSVSDNGPGVPAQYHSRIFEKFFRVPGTPKTGAGLGLSIAREFVRAHRGQIGVESEPGQGSEFYFLLPLD